MEKGYTKNELAYMCNIHPKTVARWVRDGRKTLRGRPLPQYQKTKNGEVFFNRAESDVFSSFVRNNAKKKNLGYELRECKCPFCEKIFSKKIPTGSFSQSVKYCRIYCTDHAYFRYTPEDIEDFKISGIISRVRVV